MKVVIRNIVLLSSLMVILFAACRKNPPSSEDAFIGRRINIFFVDSNGQNVVGNNHLYKENDIVMKMKDSILSTLFESYYNYSWENSNTDSAYLSCVYYSSIGFVNDPSDYYNIRFEDTAFFYFGSMDVDTFYVEKHTRDSSAFYWNGVYRGSIHAMDFTPFKLKVVK